MDNLKYYNMGRSVPDSALKPIAAGRLKGMSDINPMWRIKMLTKMFGPAGVGWWYEITDKHLEHDPISKQTAAFVDIKLYYVDPDTGVESHGTHPQYVATSGGSISANLDYASYSTSAKTAAQGIPTGATGSGTAFNILPPYLVVYMWKRTA